MTRIGATQTMSVTSTGGTTPLATIPPSSWSKNRNLPTSSPNTAISAPTTPVSTASIRNGSWVYQRVAPTNRITPTPAPAYPVYPYPAYSPYCRAGVSGVPHVSGVPGGISRLGTWRDVSGAGAPRPGGALRPWLADTDPGADVLRGGRSPRSIHGRHGDSAIRSRRVGCRAAARGL